MPATDEPERILSLEQYSVWIGQRHIVKDVSLTVPPRRVTAIIGPSGSGKSTLLKSLVRLAEDELGAPDSLRCIGKARFAGIDLFTVQTRHALQQLRRSMVYVSQIPAPFPMSIKRNITFALKDRCPEVSRDDLDEIVARVLREAWLWEEVKDRLSDDARALSTGQIQQLCLARALALDPVMLLLDEPCANTDPRTTSRLEDLFMNLREARTILLVTHNLQQAARVSDYALFMYNGVVREFGKTRKLFTVPQDQTLLDFLTGRFG
jgi:phosphate transport system ATP-binding protein